MTTYYIGHTASGRLLYRASKRAVRYTHAAAMSGRGETFSVTRHGAEKQGAAEFGRFGHAYEIVELRTVEAAEYRSLVAEYRRLQERAQ